MQSILPTPAAGTLPTVVMRHRRENLKKCSLRGLETRPDFLFYSYPRATMPDLSNYVLLSFDGPLLGPDDSASGLFILDATWRYAEKMLRFVEGHASLPRRSIPKNFRTAYPRRQEDCPFPEYGLASIEAIYVAYLMLGRDTTGLLDSYYWKEAFFDINKKIRPAAS